MGASAGGIEAWQTFLDAVPPDSGIAFVLVLHLDPTRASHIAEILQGSTANLAITQATGPTRIEPDHAYVIAPNSKLHIAEGVLEVEPLAEREVRSGLVDYLFTSLAEAEGPRSAGVVLSGAGHDGTIGLRRIREAGGLTVAQDPATASTSSMPEAAIAANVVDLVLAPADIPAALIDFALHGRRPPRKDRPSGPAEVARGRGIDYIIQQLGEMADVDFADYKMGTLERRTRRRMGLVGIRSIEAYADYLADHPHELDALYRDVLIGVTRFFRDPPVWEQLAEVLPLVLADRDTAGMRAWVVGCGTGEEAYSLAILLHELLPPERHGEIQVYATDLNERALAAARRGVYSAGSLQHVSPQRRQRYFHERDGQVQVDRSLRDLVTFAPHNALRDAPFSRMDVVTCRNLLIYLRPHAHDELLKRLHFALRTGGLLVLGRAETLGRQTERFDAISKPHNIFRARGTRHHDRFEVRPRARGRVGGGQAAGPAAAAPVGNRSIDRDRRVEQFVLRERAPACVVVDSDLEIRHFYGPTMQYLAPPTGESRQDLLAWIRSGFYIPLRSALKQAVEGGQPVTTEGQINRDGMSQRVRCTVEPLPEAIAKGLYLVTFRDLGDPAPQNLDAQEPQEPLVRELEQELSDTRHELQVTIEQLESAAEQHHASNEEMQSLNEELQSSNEELEASKEELEALNEEMTTINRELEQKNAELRESNADLNALFVNTGIPTVFLDRHLRVRRFTAAATGLMHLVPSDIGRSIEHIKQRFVDGQTSDTAQEVLTTLEPDSSEIVTEHGSTYVRTIAPYRTEEDEVAGVCITFSDVTQQKRAAQASEAARIYAEAVIETVRTPVLVLDQHLRIVSANRAFRESFGSGDSTLGRTLSDTRHMAWNVPALDEIVEAVLADGTDVNDFEIRSQDRVVLTNIRPVDREDGSESVVVMSFEDVTHSREAQLQAERRAEELKEDARRKDQWIAMLGHELRNPVGAIGNAVALLKSEPPVSERQSRAVEVIGRQVTHMAGLLDDLLDAARIISGKLDIERRPVDVAEIGEWAADSIRGLVEEKEHEFSVALPPSGTVWVLGDPLRLTEVIVNLLTNAAKYTEPRGQLWFDVGADADTVTIRVRDTGVGIPGELQNEIFEIFTQGPRTFSRTDRGLGLGLPLVRTLVELHGGSVSVISEGAGRGSEFRVALPRLRHSEHPLVPASLREVSAAQRQRRVLIVDDEPDVADTLGLLLQARGHEARWTTDGVAALEAAGELQPEIALLDLGLPGMDGYELARRLREAFPSVRLIAITGYQRDADRLQEAGFDDHLIKPIDTGALLALIEETGPGGEPGAGRRAGDHE